MNNKFLAYFSTVLLACGLSERFFQKNQIVIELTINTGMRKMKSLAIVIVVKMFLYSSNSINYIPGYCVSSIKLGTFLLFEPTAEGNSIVWECCRANKRLTKRSKISPTS